MPPQQKQRRSTPPSLYEIIGVERTATDDAIRAAFRSLARQHHPDVGGDAARFTEIARAYEVLSDPAKRSAYDAELDGAANTAGDARPGEPHYSWSNLASPSQTVTRRGRIPEPTELDEIYDVFFGDRSPPNDKRQTRKPKR
jgi:curved DNA-binding protein CbpA